jgi:hypothetical protein
MVNKHLVKQFGEVFTPLPLVNEMLDKLPVDLWSNPNLKWIDPSCGSGNFLLEIKNRLLKNFSEEHILTNMIYGVEIQQKNCIEAINRVGKFNLAYADALKFDYWGGMKFDVVVGNPPYQEIGNNCKNKGGGENLFSKFIELSINKVVDSGYVLLITPPTWMSGSKGLLQKFFLSKKLIYLEVGTSSIYFKGVGSQFSWYLIQNIKSDDISTYTKCFYNKKLYESNISFQNFPFLPILLSDLSVGISQKVMWRKENKLGFQYDQKSHPYSAKMKGKTVDKESSSNPFPMYYNANRILWSSVELTQQHVKKVLVSFSGYLKPYYDNGIMGVSHMTFFMPVSCVEEGNKVIRLLNSKLFKFLLSIYKWNGWNNKEVLNSLHYPKDLVDDFSDVDLYDYFGLTEDEVLLIESTVK